MIYLPPFLFAIRHGKNMDRLNKSVVGIAVAAALLGCGGGGSDAGTSGFGTGAGSSTAGGTTAGTAAGTGTEVVPVTTGGGISTVSSGIPSQRFMSISAESYNLDWGFDGKTTTIQIYIADTAGNPVPDGSIVQFSTEGGQIETSCRTAGVKSGTSTISGCSVKFNTQDYRPLDGKVTVIAWMAGEEAYRDVNGNGKYDAGEPFIDSGRIFRDDDNSLAVSAADELLIDTTLTGAPGIGTASCAAAPTAVNVNEVPRSIPSTCDGQWGQTLIRRTLTLPVSDPRYLFVSPIAGVGVVVYTAFSSSPVAAPAGTTVAVLNAPANCTIAISPSTVGNTELDPTVHNIVGTASVPGACSGKSVLVEAKFGTYTPRSTTYVLP